jgi:hypothetical protein
VRRDQDVIDVDRRLAGDDDVVGKEQLVDLRHRAGDGILDRDHRVGDAAVVDGVEGLFERGTGHEPRLGTQQELSCLLAVGAGRALIGAIRERSVDVDVLHGRDRGRDQYP